jgi:hypothetical protein
MRFSEKEKNMKANTIHANNLARPMAWCVAALVLTMTFTCVRRAYAAALVPNHIENIYVLAAGGNSPDFAMPITNSPVTINGTVTSLVGGLRGVGHIRATYATTGGAPTIVWTGQHGTGGISVGQTAAQGVGMTLFSGAGGVFLRTAPAPAPAVSWLDVANTTGFGGVVVVVEMTW